MSFLKCSKFDSAPDPLEKLTALPQTLYLRGLHVLLRGEGRIRNGKEEEGLREGKGFVSRILLFESWQLCEKINCARSYSGTDCFSTYSISGLSVQGVSFRVG